MSPKEKKSRRVIEVWAHWEGMEKPIYMGDLACIPTRESETFSFEYDPSWLKSRFAQQLDPSLMLYRGPQYVSTGKENFGIFLDSAPDRWGRFLMRRREAQLAREQNRPVRNLQTSDYLLGVYDAHRIGGLRFREDPNGPFLDNNRAYASPPWASLRDLEFASIQLEKDDAETKPEYGNWLRLLIAPGASLGGARPKASVVDQQGHLWIAKFPKNNDAEDTGAWEAVVHELASRSGIRTTFGKSQVFSGKHHTFLTKRFDRTESGKRIHFASAMTLLNRVDGDDASQGVSYLDLAEFLSRGGAKINEDLEELWRRVVFFICVSNVDDHLRNHGFLLIPDGWVLSPCYDMNPDSLGNGLKLNISESDNSQDLDLAFQVARHFRLTSTRPKEIVQQIVGAVKKWRDIAKKYKISSSEQERMSSAFRVADAYSVGKESR